MGYSILEKRVKRILDDIIDVAYADRSEQQRKLFKWYDYNVIPKEVGSYCGRYIYKGHRIEIHNGSLGPSHLAKCSLHELAHHIDYIENGTSGHQKPFYEAYTKLIYASLDMGILNKNDFDDNWSSDRNKVKKIVSLYQRTDVAYEKKDMQTIKVYNSFKIKDTLKARDYGYNPIEYTWEKDFESGLEIEEAIYLESLNVKREKGGSNLKNTYFEIQKMNMYIDALVLIGVTGNTYEKKEYLKPYGFYYKPEGKTWIAKCKSSEQETFIKTLNEDPNLSGLQFGIAN